MFFKPVEFLCPCCGVAEMNPVLLDKLEKLRAEIGLPLYVNSAYRCADHNNAVDGKSGSKHLTGEAVDISTYSMTAQQKHAFLKLVMENFKGVGIAKTFIHMDIREAPAIWFY